MQNIEALDTIQRLEQELGIERQRRRELANSHGARKAYGRTRS
jgi:hypothetical protein